MSLKPLHIVLMATLLLVVACNGKDEELPGAEGMPTLSFLCSLQGTDGGEKLLGEGYTFVGYYDNPDRTMPGYARQLAEQWQAVVLLKPRQQVMMYYDKQLDVSPYPYADVAARLKTIINEERTLVPDTAVASFRATIVDSPTDSTTATRSYTSRTAFRADVLRYLSSADSVASYPKVITFTTTSSNMAIDLEFARGVGNGLKQTSITITRT